MLLAVFQFNTYDRIPCSSFSNKLQTSSHIILESNT